MYNPWTTRLANIDQRTQIELRASDLVWAIEKMGAHPLLTEAQSLVQQALQTLGAWTDSGEPGVSDSCYYEHEGDAHHEHFMLIADAIPPIPEDVSELVLRIGRAEWGATELRTAEEHGAELAKSIQMTDEAFNQSGPQSLHGLYQDGSDVIMCHVGTSPNSPGIAQAMAGAWNWLYDTCEAQSS